MLDARTAQFSTKRASRHCSVVDLAILSQITHLYRIEENLRRSQAGQENASLCA